MSLSLNSKATIIFFISFSIASLHRVVSVSLSFLSAYLTVFGNLIPNLCVFFWCAFLTFEMIRSLRLSAGLTHHLNAGSSAMLFPQAYSAISIGWDCFKSLNLHQDNDPSFHETNNSQPLVVLFGCLLPLLLMIYS